jgi:hypothetical protein
MNTTASRTGLIVPALATPATEPAPSLPVVTANVLETLIRLLAAETTRETASRSLPTPSSPQVRFGMD